MKRSAAHKPRYSHLTRERASYSHSYRRAKAQETLEEPSDEFSSKDDSSDRYTDETDETSGGSSPRKRNFEWNNGRNYQKGNHIHHRGKEHVERNTSQPYYYVDGNRFLVKERKISEKNVPPPMTTFLATSTRSMLPQFPGQVPIIKSRITESISTPPKKSSKKMNNSEDKMHCFHHYQHNHKDKQIDEKFSGGLSKCQKMDSGKSDGIPSSEPPTPEDTIKPTSVANETDNFPKKSTDCSTSFYKGGDFHGRESGSNKVSAGSKIEKSDNRKTKSKSSDSEKEIIVHNAFSQRRSADESMKKTPNGSDVKTREKLVYVVEEDGTETTKLETDLFSVNEILNIKKDLLELSEFAKKLKKLKEMKKESDKGKKNGKSCHCKPTSDLLKDVNKRMETLEAKQNELEKESNKNKKKSFLESEPKKPEAKIDSNSFEKKLGTGQTEEFIANPILTELVVPKEEDFSNNSEIVCELMDLKTKLQKLEKKKLSKESNAQVSPPFIDNTKKKGHAIAVFSSRTYILASPNNLEKKKQEKNFIKSETNKMDNSEALGNVKSGKITKPEEIDWKSKTDKTQENVSNWLKTVPTSSSDPANEFFGGAFNGSETQKDGMREKDGKLPVFSARCRKCSTELTNEDLKFQERRKNSSFEKEAEKSDLQQGKNEKRPDEFISHFQCRECFLTDSGRFFGLGRKSSPKNSGDSSPAASKISPLYSPNEYITSTLMNLLQRTTSSYSIPSAAFVTQECAKKLSKNPNFVDQDESNLNSSLSKSMQELNAGCMNASKNEKTIRNAKTKSSGNGLQSRSVEVKESKESKNEMVKIVDEIKKMKESKKFERVGLLPMTVSSESFLIRDVSLDLVKSSDVNVAEGKKKTVGAVASFSVYSVTADANQGFIVETNAMPEESKKKRKKCEKLEKKRRSEEKKRLKSERKKANKKNCKLCRREYNKNLKREKKMEKSLAKKERKERRQSKLEKQKHCHANCLVQMSSDGVKKKCKNVDYHFKSKHMFSCSKQNHCVEGCAGPCEETQKCNWECDCKPLEIDYDSDYSLREYRKRRQEREEARLREEEENAKSCLEVVEEEKAKEACGLGTFLRNIRNLYPRCSYLKFFSSNKTSNKEKNDMKFQDGNSLNPEKEVTGERSDRNLTYGTQNFQDDRLQSRCHHCNKPPIENCQCVKVYLETQNRSVNLKPERRLSYSLQSSTEDKSSETSRSDELVTKDDSYITRCVRPDEGFMFPYRKSQVYHVDHVDHGDYSYDDHRCTKEQIKAAKKYRKEDKKYRKEEKRRMKKEEKERRKRERKERKRRKKRKCICPTCGNVHKRKKCKKRKVHKEKKKKKKKKKEKHEVTYEDDYCKDEDELGLETHAEEKHADEKHAGKKHGDEKIKAQKKPKEKKPKEKKGGEKKPKEKKATEKKGGGKKAGKKKASEEHVGETHDDEKHGGKKHGGKKHEGKKHEGKKHEDKKHEDKKHEDKKHGGKKHEGKKHEDKKHEGKKHEGKKHEGKKHEGKKHEAKKHEGKKHGKEKHPHPEEATPSHGPETAHHAHHSPSPTILPRFLGSYCHGKSNSSLSSFFQRLNKIKCCGDKHKHAHGEHVEHADHKAGKRQNEEIVSHASIQSTKSTKSTHECRCEPWLEHFQERLKNLENEPKKTKKDKKKKKKKEKKKKDKKHKKKKDKAGAHTDSSYADYEDELDRKNRSVVQAYYCTCISEDPTETTENTNLSAATTTATTTATATTTTTNTDATNTDVTNTDVTNTDVTNTDVTNTDVTNTDATNTDVTNTDITNTESTNTDTSNTDTTTNTDTTFNTNTNTDTTFNTTTTNTDLTSNADTTTTATFTATGTTTGTTTVTSTTSGATESTATSKDESNGVGKLLRNKLSSLQSFWQRFRNLKKRNHDVALSPVDVFHSHDLLPDDLTESSSDARRNRRV